MGTWSSQVRFAALAPADRLCELLADPARWPEISEQVVWAKIEEPLRRGAEGKVRCRGARARRVRVIAWNPPYTFVLEVALPLARLRFDNQLTRSYRRTVITHRVSVTGPLARLWVWLHGDALRDAWKAAAARADSLALMDALERPHVLH